MKSIAIIGCGALGSIVAKGIGDQRLADSYRLIGVCDISNEAAQRLAAECGCEAYTSIDELLALKADYVVEAAGGGVLKACAQAVLRAGSELIALSVGAFADTAFYEAVKQTAHECGRKVHLASGAIGGFDLIRSAAWSGELNASIHSEKPPKGLNGASILNGRLLSEEEPELLFDGNAVEAIKNFPKNVNVAVALAIASNGVEQTNVKVSSIPGRTSNTHRITLDGDFGHAELAISARPSNTASSSSLAAYSVLAKLERLCSDISF